MSSARSDICSEKEGSVVNLDVEESISWSFHFMIYTISPRSTALEPFLRVTLEPPEPLQEIGTVWRTKEMSVGLLGFAIVNSTT